jgi:DNA invertase Pin-like site-specific DNA recombinase
MTTANVPKTAIYCRTARKSAKGISAQREMLTRYANEHGCCDYSVFVDDGVVGSHIDRPAFQAVLAEIRAGDIKRVLTKDISRLCRNPILCAKVLSTFRQYEVELISVSDGFNSKADESSRWDFMEMLSEAYQNK